MSDSVIVEHVDFVSFLTQDIQRAKRFYAETLGLEIETEGPDDMEFRAGQVTLERLHEAVAGERGSVRASGRRGGGRIEAAARRARHLCDA